MTVAELDEKMEGRGCATRARYYRELALELEGKLKSQKIRQNKLEKFYCTLLMSLAK